MQHTMDQVAEEMQVAVAAAPLDSFLPIPPDAGERHRLLGRFGPLEVFIFDPHTIALSRIDRGFDTDMDDVVFLLRSETVETGQLCTLLEAALARPQGFDISPAGMRRHLGVVLAGLQQPLPRARP